MLYYTTIFTGMIVFISGCNKLLRNQHSTHTSPDGSYRAEVFTEHPMVTTIGDNHACDAVFLHDLNINRDLEKKELWYAQGTYLIIYKNQPMGYLLHYLQSINQWSNNSRLCRLIEKK